MYLCLFVCLYVCVCVCVSEWMVVSFFCVFVVRERKEFEIFDVKCYREQQTTTTIITLKTATVWLEKVHLLFQCFTCSRSSVDTCVKCVL